MMMTLTYNRSSNFKVENMAQDNEDNILLLALIDELNATSEDEEMALSTLPEVKPVFTELGESSDLPLWKSR
jgi:hypothetical protein